MPQLDEKCFGMTGDGCGNTLAGKTFYDRFNKRTLCAECWEKMFRFAEQNGMGEWFEANYKPTDYAPEFWQKVGAFVKLPPSGDGYSRKEG